MVLSVSHFFVGIFFNCFYLTSSSGRTLSSFFLQRCVGAYFISISILTEAPQEAHAHLEGARNRGESGDEVDGFVLAVDTTGSGEERQEGQSFGFLPLEEILSHSFWQDWQTNFSFCIFRSPVLISSDNYSIGLRKSKQD